MKHYKIFNDCNILSTQKTLFKLTNIFYSVFVQKVFKAENIYLHSYKLFNVFFMDKLLYSIIKYAIQIAGYSLRN